MVGSGVYQYHCHLAKATVYDKLNFYVDWKQGKENPKKPGTHYKDLVAIRPA